MNPGRRLFVALYAASGAAALVYEVTWTRLFSLQLGHTVAAASTVLAAFMGGLAVGASMAGSKRWITLRAYAALEAAVAICALALPFALGALTPALAWAYADGTAPARLALVRIVLSLLLLGVPAAAMGATFPVAASWFSASAADAGMLYAANTAGAAIGAVAAGFWLIPAIGLAGTTAVGVALNIVAASGALWIANGVEFPASAGSAQNQAPRPVAATSQRPRRAHQSTRAAGAMLPSPPPSTSSSTPPSTKWIAWSAVGVSGFAALVYEVAWTRLLAMIIGPTTYAFATMAAAFVAGLALGSAAGTRIARRWARTDVWLAAMLVTSGVAATVTSTIAARSLPLTVATQLADPNVVFARIVASEAVAVALLLAPMTLPLGATFPLALASAAREGGSIGAEAASIYTANTVGAIAGALVGGFVLIPAFGLRAAFVSASLLAIATGIACWMGVIATRAGARQPRIRQAVRPALVGAAASAIVLALPGWDRALLASGAYKYAPYLVGADLDAVLRAGRLEYYREGAAGTVSVRVLTGTRALAIDGKVDASDGGDMLTQRMLGLLPVLIHGRAREICIIGLGSGVTAASALAPGTVLREDVVEISPEVVEASRFFVRENGDVLRNPAVRLLVGDGRSHLLLSRRQYDVVVSEPSNPWMAGVASLFTREFFEYARSRLKPDGLLCQWAHTYDISDTDLRSIVRTFASVFPQGSMWLVGEGDLLLIGARDGAIEARLAALGETAHLGATPAMLDGLGAVDGKGIFGIASLYAGGPAELARFADAAPIQNDDRTRLEYSAPRAIYGRNGGENAVAIRALRPTLPPALATLERDSTASDWRSRGAMLLRAEAFSLSFDAYRRAVARDPRNSAALSGLSEAAAGAHRQTEARADLEALALRDARNAPVRVELSHLLAATGDLPAAAASARAALEIAPDDPRTAEQLASVLADAGDADRLAPLADALVQRFPDRPDPRYYQATAQYLRGRTEEAISTLRHIVEAHPSHGRAQNLLGAACAAAGDSACARKAFEAAIEASPRDPSPYVNLGVFRVQTGDALAALDPFGQALALDPQSEAARNGLAQARAALVTNPR